RLIQAAGFPAASLLRPGTRKRRSDTAGEFLHLTEHQACSTIVAQRSFLDEVGLRLETSSISSGKAVALQARLPLPNCDHAKLLSRANPILNNTQYPRCHKPVA